MKMKTSGIILAVLIGISTILSAQTTEKTDSVKQEAADTLNLQSDSTQLKFQNQNEIDQPKLFQPDDRKKPTNYPFAYIPRENSRYLNNPNYRMPIAKPYFESKMPVMKPDSTIHFHLQIKKIGPTNER
jgi:hypothetical protein